MGRGPSRRWLFLSEDAKGFWLGRDRETRLAEPFYDSSANTGAHATVRVADIVEKTAALLQNVIKYAVQCAGIEVACQIEHGWVVNDGIERSRGKHHGDICAVSYDLGDPRGWKTIPVTRD